MTRRLSLEEATGLAVRAGRAAGLSDEAALALARATVSANAHGKGSSGFSHLVDYLSASRAGRIVGDAEPVLTSPAPAAIHCEASGGIAQLGFDRAFDDLFRRAETLGIALFSQNGSFTTGELGYYPRRLAEAGLVAFAATSGPALMTVAGAKKPVYCTNPIAFAAPLDQGPPLLIDQASSATAFVQLRHYAERGEALPEGWAVDGDGEPTADPRAALTRRAPRLWRRARRQYRADGRGHGRGAHGRELGARRALVHLGESPARQRPSRDRHRARPPGAGLPEAPQKSSSTGLPSLAFIFRGGARPPPRSNCPRRS